MTVAGDEVPVLGLGRDTTQAITTALLTGAGLLRERRLAQGRLAWSDARNAARLHDIQERVANPRVRAMNDAEREQWDHTTPETRHVDGATGSVAVSVAPVGDRWGVVAQGTTADGQPGETAFVSCVDETTAKRLADELLAAGPSSVQRLRQFATLASERAEAARERVAEPEEQRLARTAAVVREVWDDWLGEVVVESPAFGAFAWRLHEMEELGYSMKDVLYRIGGEQLRSHDVRDPAALAEWYVEKMVEKELRSGQVINLDSEEILTNLGSEEVIDLDSEEILTDPAHRRSGTSTDGDPAPAIAAAERPEPDPEQAARRDAIEPVLAEALPADVLEEVRRSRTYDSTVTFLHQLSERGATLEPLLRKLPVDRIAAAHEPGGYLAAVLRRRAEQNLPRRTGVNRTAMAELVHEGLPREVADRVVGCRAWPTLAGRLANWNGQGLPLVEMMNKLPAARVHDAEKPAAYVAALLGRAVAAATPERDEPQRAEQQISRSAAERATDATGDSELRWTEELDPDDPIDRVGLEATRGQGSDRRVIHLEQQLQPAEDGPGVDTADPDESRTPAEAATNSQPDPARAAERAEVAERTSAPYAAAARAEVALTPSPGDAQDPAAPTERVQQAPPVPTRAMTPERERGLHR